MPTTSSSRLLLAVIICFIASKHYSQAQTLEPRYPHDVEVQIATTHSQSFALAQDGSLWAWGDGVIAHDEEQQPNTLVSTAAATLLYPPRDMGVPIKIAASSSLYIIDSHQKLWHYSTTFTPVSFPDPDIQIIDVSCNISHTLALDSEGRVWSWGYPVLGQLGLGLTPDYENFEDSYVTEPQQVTLPAGMTDPQAIYTGLYSSHATDLQGRLWSWGGDNALGHFITPSSNDSSIPHPLLTSDGEVYVSSYSGGYSFATAVGLDGRLYSWGLDRMNDTDNYGNLGRGPASPHTAMYDYSYPPYFYMMLYFYDPYPAKVHLPQDLSVLSHTTTSAVTSDGALWSWGDNIHLRHPHADQNQTNAPIQLTMPEAFPGAQSMAASPGTPFVHEASQAHTLVLATDGSLWSWGSNAGGQLGLNHTDTTQSPEKIPFLKLFDDDADQDALPDSWELYHFSTTDAAPSEDPDQDGINNLVEYRFGLDPLAMDDPSLLPPPPTAPNLLSVTQNADGSHTYIWEHPAQDAHSYHIHVRKNEGPWQRIYTAPAGTTTVTLPAELYQDL